MNWLGMMPVLIGIFYLISCIWRRDKVAYRNRRFSKTNEIIVLKRTEFLELQLKYSVFNSLFLIILGVLITIFTINNIFILVALIPFQLMDFILIVESKKKGYVNYKVGGRQ